MSGRPISIAILMKLTAIIALNLALFRVGFDPSILLAPPFLFVVVLIDHALVQSAVFGRPLGTFYVTFLFVGILSTGVGTVLAISPDGGTLPGSLHLLGALIQHLRAVLGQNQVT